jgi:hypothetical protein
MQAEQAAMNLAAMHQPVEDMSANGQLDQSEQTTAPGPEESPPESEYSNPMGRVAQGIPPAPPAPFLAEFLRGVLLGIAAGVAIGALIAYLARTGFPDFGGEGKNNQE